MNRHTFILKGLIYFYGAILFGQSPLKIPDTLSGEEIYLRLQKSEYGFYPGVKTQTMGVNGDILGPTIMLHQGQTVKINVDNQLGEATSLHWHGMHVSPENDGGPHTPIASGEVWKPSFTVKDKASVYWYHPHLHHKTNEHVSLGVAGLIIVRDTAERRLDLPKRYGRDDFPLILQTRDFDDNNQIVIHSNNDNVPMVNATINPYLDVPAQVVRFRVLNGSSQRAFMLGLSNNQSFFIIGTDGGLLEKPVSTKRMLISSGERAEILVDLTGMAGQSLQLMSFASELPNGIYGAVNPGMSPMMMLHGYNPNPLNGNDFSLLKLNVQPKDDLAVLQVPDNLVTIDRLDIAMVDVQRNFLFTPSQMGMNQLNNPFLINARSFDMERIDFKVRERNIEIWELRNQSATSHPFHVHDVQFRILSRNGIPPTAYEAGRKDVVMIRPGETVRIIMQFKDYSNSEIPYMYHCHLLTHEDDGMMGQFLVEAATNTNDKGLDTYRQLEVYPNPFDESVRLQIPDHFCAGEGEVHFEMRSMDGVLVREGRYYGGNNENIMIQTEKLSSGCYILSLQKGPFIMQKLMIKK